MAAKKTAAKPVAAVSDDTPTPAISSDLKTARDEIRKAEVAAGVKDDRGGLVEQELEIGLDPALAKAREAALEVEKNRKTY